METNVTRRRFVGMLGLGSLGLGGAAMLSACSSTNNAASSASAVTGAATAPAASRDEMPGMSGGATQTTPSAPAQAAPAMAPDQLDAADLDKLQQFLANIKAPITQGKGGVPLEYELDGEIKVFTITASKTFWQTVPGEPQEVYAYNAMLPGPEIRVTEGDKVRVILRNGLPESTTIHFHGLQGVANGMDGVGNLTQPPVKPGQTFSYEFVAKNPGTHMYHSHINAMQQVGGGLLGSLIIE